ncbi:MAG: enoyl-CoA hydratase/isomerase family protein [Bauldia sp.]|uniref:enoyl-CoA hydratase-related protein n=1 Tax=Bauldia sp. TaxID=2575872 RepID=UPI001DCD81A7|nr:enoyl-CoA hydratase-related protein [Bauldia sp.]MCB1494565.1 enoyl-CoA hydratase/isomerase family protein [Bauldia sp.]
MDEHISIDVKEGVQTIRIDRPEKSNAISAEMYETVADALALADHDTGIRVVLFAGMPGVFTAGHDVDDLRSHFEASTFGESSLRFVKTLATLDKPVVAAVDGLAVGIGTTMLFHCDFVVASEWSVFSSPCAGLGMPPEAGSSLLAPNIMGYHLAFELMVMGEQFDAQRALMAGLINRIVVPEDLEPVALSYARALSAKPPQAVRLARRLMRGDRREVVHRITQEANSFPDLLHSPAAHDALLEFLDRNRT